MASGLDPQCPADSATLARSGGSWRCPECRGTWLPAEQAEAALARLGIPKPDAATLSAAPSHLYCPEDGAALAFFIQRGKRFHICPRCQALWLEGVSGVEVGFVKRLRRRSALFNNALKVLSALVILWSIYTAARDVLNYYGTRS